MAYTDDNLRRLREQLKGIQSVLLSFLRDYERFFENDVGMAKLITGPRSREELRRRIETIRDLLGALESTLNKK